MNKRGNYSISALMLLILIINSSSVFAQDKKYKVVYNVLHDTATFNYEIFVTDIDGSNQKNISNYKGMDWTYGSYKDKVYFISDRDTTCKRCYKLYEMNSDGENVRKISDLVLEDSWMDINKAGTEIIVTGRIGREIRSQLFLVNLGDGSYKQLTNDTAAYYNDPVFSPDGKQIAFRYRPNRRDRKQKVELFIMNRDMSGMRQLSFYPADDTTAKNGEYYAGPPTWNEKENYISYISFQKGKHQIHAVSPDGTKHWQVTDNNEFEAGWHDWSKDGEWMVADMSKKQKGFDIYLIRTKDKKLIRLTDSWKTEQAPAFVEATK